MIYTTYLVLPPEKTAAPRTSTLTLLGASLRRFIDAVREGVTRTRAALAQHNGFDAQ